MTLPTRILDLHVHLFNARYLPLASIIADAMGKDESRLARGVAKLLNALTGSAYETPVALAAPAAMQRASGGDPYLDAIWEVTRHELLLATRSPSLMRSMGSASDALVNAPAHNALPIARLLDSELMTIIQELDDIDYAAEGWVEDAEDAAAASTEPLASRSALSILGRSERIVKKALRIVVALMDPDAWGEAHNYLEFFFTMLRNEDRMVDKLYSVYGDGLPPIEAMHYMMDMQLAYPVPAPPYYPFQNDQIRRMQALQRRFPGKIYGFCAFDPRRESWRDIADDARLRGLSGFKFYPSLGYKPSGTADATLQSRIDEFFRYCVDHSMPIFVHCTPVGFQTRKNEGGNAHPKYWEPVLTRHPDLRLCFGHAGGGRVTKNNKLVSAGWDAETETEWKTDNYAQIVASLCMRYEHVYCEFGHLTELEEEGGMDRLLQNLERARAKNDGPWDLLDKLAYGTDWHMPAMIGKTRAYLEIFLQAFDRDEYAPYRERFFWQNGYRYLGL